MRSIIWQLFPLVFFHVKYLYDHLVYVGEGRVFKSRLSFANGSFYCYRNYAKRCGYSEHIVASQQTARL